MFGARLSAFRNGMIALIVAATATAVTPTQAAPPDFEREVAPILLNRCLECHSGGEPAGDLDLTTEPSALKGGQSGPVIDRDRPDESLLLQRVVDGEMPPPKHGKSRALPAVERDRLARWLTSGSPWPAGRALDPFEVSTESHGGRDLWSLQPLRRPVVPSLRESANVSNSIDAFIRAPLEVKGWTPAPTADRRTLIRRVQYDLLGFPPSFEEIEAFANDPSTDAYERLVDRLLASPHFGERWARHWLDVARYAETSGYERDQPKPHAWKYRDWVVQAMNQDMPFDQFVMEQLAGDELPEPSESTVTATGFLRLGTWNDEPNDPNEYKYERLEDVVHATSTAFLAMTVKCARCHDHKFDPIRQTDYYRMAAVFWAGPIEPGPRELLGGPTRELLGYDVLGWTDLGPRPSPIHLLKKGEPHRPGPVVEPGQLSMVPALDRPMDPPPPGSKTSKRRLQFARWVVDPANPLTARVWVNRVWQWHFGQGLARSPDNFGFNGERPTHPELLDWLASELIEGGWTTKRLHRLIVLSQTYRQSSIHPRGPEYAREDAGNRAYWRAERRRLDAESLRDALLTASGALDRGAIGGPSFLPEIAPDALEGLSMKDKAWTPSPPEEQSRRALYIHSKRGLLSPFLTTFDVPDTTLPCGQRDVTLVPPQALVLLNDAFVHAQSERLARAILNEEPSPSGQARQAWRRVLGRDPRPDESAAAVAHLAEQASRFADGPGGPRLLALASLCHVLMNCNEFLYVD
ncbi:MAG: PSD1 and planctomycete cytochrome C domain-containing protein [Isosphaeraceae bacterium]